MTKRIISIVLTVMMLLGLFAVSATVASAAGEPWADQADTSWYNDEQNEFSISTGAQLAGLAKLVNEGNTFADKTVKLTADIDLADAQWTPIGYLGKTFKGTFDGGSKTISNLNATYDFANESANNGIGLFGRTDSPAVIKNLTVENATVKGSLYVGVIVGLGSTGNGISNVHVKGDIAVDAWWYAGAIGGYGYTSSVSNCTVVGNDGSYIKGNDGSYIGGIWGFRGEGGMSIIACEVSNVAISGVDRVGGISGMAHYGNTISTCSVSGVTVTATDPDCISVGLIAGANNGTAASPTVVINNVAEDTSANVAGTPVTSITGGTNVNGVTEATVVGTGVTFDDAGKITSGDFEITPPESAIADDCSVKETIDGSISVVATSMLPTGSIGQAIINDHKAEISNGEWVTIYSEATIKGTESMVVALYAGDELLATTTLVDADKVLLTGSDSFVTYHIFLEGSDSWWNTEWKVAPVANKVPTKVVLFVDDIKVDENLVNLSNTNDNMGSATVTYNWGDVGGVKIAVDADGNYYESLQDAIDNATSAITLLGDTKVAAEDDKPETQIWVKEGKNVVIDLNGNTVDGAFYINGTATIKNGSIINNSVVSAIETKGTLTLDNVTAISDRHAIRISGGTTTFISGTYQTVGTSGTRHAVNASGGAHVVIEGGNFVGAAEANLGGSGNCLMLNGATAEVKGGNFYGSNGVEGDICPNKGLVISGGNFTRWNNYDNYVADGKAMTQLADGTYGVVDAVVSIGNKGYATVADAAAAAKNGDTIKLLADVTASETIKFNGGFAYTLDLNGKTLTVHTASGDGILVDNSSTLTIVSIEAEGTFVFSSDKKGSDAIQVNTNSTLNLENGVTLKGTPMSNNIICADTADGKGTSTINLNGAKIEIIGETDHDHAPIVLEKNSVLNMNSGSITVNATNTDTDAINIGGVLVYPYNGTANFNGGTITVDGNNANLGGIILSYYNGKDNGVATVDGTNFVINSENKGTGYVFLNDIAGYAKMDYQSGSVTGNVSEFAIDIGFMAGIEEKTLVSGGTFPIPVPEKYCADGKASVENGDGTYVVGDDWYTSCVANNNTFIIMTAEDLFNFAKYVNNGTTFAGETVTLGADIDLAGRAWLGIGVYKDETKSFQGIFDGNGKTISNVTFADASGGNAASEANNYRGFFNQIVNATVKNLTVAGDVWATAPASTEYGGALIVGCSINSTIEACVAEGSVNGTHNVAGVVVRVQDSSIIGCINNADLTGSYSKMGGIAALVQNSTTGVLFDSCVNKGTITSTARGEDGVGGIVGWIGYPNTANITVKNCENKGTIDATGVATTGQIAAESWNGNHIFEGNKGLATMVATGHAAMNGLNYAIVENGVATYVKDIAVGNTYLVTASGAKPVIKLAAGESITFDQSIATIDESGITTTLKLVKTIDGDKVTYTAIAVAEVNGVQYGSLQAAIDAAGDGDTVTLLENITVNAEDGKPATHVWVKADDNVIIDLNGKTITGAIFVNGKATIKNGTIVNNSVVSGIETEGDLTLENMTITSNRHAIRVAGGIVLIKSGVYTTTADSSTSGYALNVKSSGKTVVTIEGGEFYGSATGSVTGKSAVTVQNANCSIIIKGGKFVSGATEGTAYSVENYSPDSMIQGGEFVGGLVNGYKNITGGTFNTDVAKMCASGYTTYAAGDDLWKVMKAAGNSAYVSNNNGVVTIWGEATNADPVSELYMDILAADGTVMGKVVLNDVDGIYAAATESLTWHAMVLGTEYDTYWTTIWNEGYPKADVQPATVVLYIDGVKVHEAAVNMSGTDGMNPVVWNELFVAEVDGTVYGSIQAAIDAANGTEITLLVDTTENVITEKAFVLNLNGKTVTGYFFLNGKATIKNGKIDSTASGKSGIESSKGAVVTTEELEIISKRHAIRVDGGELIVNSGIYTTIGNAGAADTCHAINAGAGDYGYAKVTINGGTFNGLGATNAYETQDSGAAIAAQTGATITVNGGIFNGRYAETVANNYGGTYILNGGTFDQNPLVTGATLGEKKAVKKVSDTEYQVIDGVALIGNTYYATLQDAINAADAGVEITLLADIIENGINIADGKNVVIDLNGHTVTGWFWINGKATIKNGTIMADNKSAIEINTSETIDGVGGNSFAAELTLVNINTNSVSRHAIRIDGGNVSITGGNHVGGYHGFNISSGATVVIDVESVTGSSAGAAIAVRDAIVTINGGKLLGEHDALYGQLTVWSGNVTVNYAECADVASDVDLIIKGGIFGQIVKMPNRGISGGTFTVNPSEYVASGYVVRKGGDLYEVVEAVAKIDDTYYATLQDAIDAAEAGDIIKVLADIVLEPTNGTDGTLTKMIVINKDITLDLNGMTISLAKKDSLVGMPCILTINGAKVTITGNGTINGSSGNCAVYTMNVVNGGSLTIENGTFIGAPTVIQVTKGSLIINDGSFASVDAYAHYAPQYLINCIDGNYENGTATVAIAGGMFKYWNPACNVTEGAHTHDYAVAGKIGVADEYGWYTIVDGEYVAQTDTQCFVTLQDAIDAAKDGDTITLLADCEITKTFKIDVGVSITINLNGNNLSTADNFNGTDMFTVSGNLTVTGDGSIYSGCDAMFNGNVTIEGNGTYTGKWTVIYAGDDADVQINGGTFVSENTDVLSVTASANVTKDAEVAIDAPEGYMWHNGTTLVKPVAYIGETGYASLAEAIAAAKDGDTITLLDGVHTMPNSVVNKNITIKGSKNAVIEMLTAVNASGTTIAFEGVTVKFDNDTYEGLQHAVKVTYTNCTIIGTQFLYASEVTFTGCTFEMYNAVTEYAVWTYGAFDVTFTDCVFNTNGKAILVYNESSTTDFVANINLTDCEFNSNGTYNDKAAVELGQTPYGENAYNLTCTNCTAETFVENPKGIPTGSKLWGNKNSMNVETGKGGSSVIIDGGENQMPAAPVAEVNGEKYGTLQEAIAAAKDGDIVTLLANIETNTQILINKSLTLILGEYTITGNVSGDGLVRIVAPDATTAIDVTIEATTGGIKTTGNSLPIYSGLVGRAKTNLTITGGTYESGWFSAVYQNNGLCTIEGGSFKSADNERVIDNYDGSEGAYYITCGKFYQFNPACLCINADDHHDHDSLAAGKNTTLVDGWYVVGDGESNLAVKVESIYDANDRCFNSLADALEVAINKGDIITLLKDCSIDMGGATITLPDNAVLDLNGYTLTIPFRKTYFAGNNITIKNGTITTGSANTYGLYLMSGSFIVEDVVCKNGINIHAEEATLTNVTVTNPNTSYYAVYAGENTKITIYSGTFKNTSKTHNTLHADGTITVYGGTFNKDVSAFVAEGYHCTKAKDATNYTVHKIVAGEAVKENESGSTCTGAGSYDLVVYCTECGAELSRDTFPVDAHGHSYTNYVYNNDAQCGIDGTETASCDHGCGETDTRTAENTALTHKYTNYVSNGDATCTADGTKTAACDNECGTTDTITDEGSKLTHSFTNYVSNGDATFDQNGTKTAYCDHGCGISNTIEDVGSQITVVAMIGENRYATIADAVANAKDGDIITLVADTAEGQVYIANCTLTIDLNGYTFDSSSNFAFTLAKNADVIVKNGTINAGNAGLYLNGIGAQAKLENVNVNAMYGVTTNNGQAVTIDGGTYDATVALQASNGGLTMIINDGVFNATGQASLRIRNGANVIINGGTFNSDIMVEDGTLTIYGGTFAVKPEAEYIAMGYFAMPFGEVYRIEGSTAVVGDQYYATLEEAIAAVNNGESVRFFATLNEATLATADGEIVTLLANTAESIVDIATDITLNLNGKTLTGRIRIKFCNAHVINGTVDASGFGTMEYAIKSYKSTVVLDNLNVTGVAYGLHAECSTVTVTGGTYTARVPVYANGTDAAVAIYGAALTGASAVIRADGNDATNVSVKVYGDTFIGAALDAKNGGTIVLYGGTYDREPVAELIADGYGINKLANGHYEVVRIQLDDTGRTLSTSDYIYVNQYFKVVGLDNLSIEYICANGGLLVWNSMVDDATALFGTQDEITEGLVYINGEFSQRTSGISAKEYADEMYIRAYVKLEDGSYIYTPVKEYSVQLYCETVINRPTAKESLKEVCATLLHYGAAAQICFNYNTADLANANILDIRPASEFDASVLDALVEANTQLTGESDILDNGRTLSLTDAIRINYYFGIADTATWTVESAKLYIWTDVEEGTELTMENVSDEVEMTLYNGEYSAQSAGIAAKDYGDTIYVRACFEDADGVMHYSEVIAFSVDEYASRIITTSSNANNIALVKRMAMYGEAAKTHFGD